MDQAPYVATPSGLDKENHQSEQAMSAVKKPAPVTPMMAQFFEIKTVNPGYLLFYRMGDFYELFFEDAEIASGALGIALTTRGAHMGKPIPMCGVPVRAHQEYLRKLISFGHRVAICEQLEDPAEAKKRGAKSVVKRDVVRLITPGTITEDDLLPAQSNNFLGSLAMVGHSEQLFALAWADISTGESFVLDLNQDQLLDELGRLDLAELILSEATSDFLKAQSLALSGFIKHLAIMDKDLFQSETAPNILSKTFPDFKNASLSRSSLSALGALVSYVVKTQKDAGIALRAPKLPDAKNQFATMQIDLATWSSLEVIKTNKGEVKGSLRHAIDKTVTAAGARLLARRLTAPLLCPKAINQRLDMVQTFVDDSLFSQKIFQALRAIPDLTRPLTRLNLQRGGPRDIAHIAQAILSAQTLIDIFLDKESLPFGLKDLTKILKQSPQKLAQKIMDILVDHPPLMTRDGQFVRQGWNEELDKQRQLATQSRTIIGQLQADLGTETDIKSLKIKHNKVLGFFIEVPAQHGKKLFNEPFVEKFIHRQTMANAMRFTTTALGELEGQISRAQQIALEIELKIFADLQTEILQATSELRSLSDAIAQIDVSFGLAKLAAEQAYCRPKMDATLAFNIKAGRHPVVEQTLAKNKQTFVTNDCDLSGLEISKTSTQKTPEKIIKEGGQLWLVTGPNMGGKSTFLRQNALIAIMAQIGSFVPASQAHIGVVDRLFSRVGASDDIAQGRSTFMVEMVETAAILNRATKNSLVILDEIGRGTATFDGLSIAWATAEALHQNNASRALFATHFHEMTSLATSLQRISNHTMKAREYKGEVVFLHEVTNGAADRSYGIQVARLAGLPEIVLERAREILEMLENQDNTNPSKMLGDLPLFSQRPASPVKQPSAVQAMVKALQPDELTPRQAIEFMYDLKTAAKDDLG